MRRQPKIVRYRYYAEGEAPAVAPGFEIHKPTRSPTLESDVAVPVVWAVLAAVFCTPIIAAVIAHVSGLSLWPLGAWVFGALLPACLIIAKRGVSDTLWSIERVLDVDLDGDGDVGAPARDPIMVKGPSAAQIVSREVKQRQDLISFVYGCADDTTYSRWEDTIGRERYEKWRAMLIDLGHACWRDPDNHRLGWELAGDPAEIVRQIL